MSEGNVKKRYKQLAPDPATGGEFDGNGMCACPACGSAYSIAEIPCEHFVGDWCFTAGYDLGSAKGQWATASDAVLIRFDVDIHDLATLLDCRDWRSEDERDDVLGSLPRHLRSALEGWGSLLDERIVGATGYLGTHELVTDGMASDAWSVHWALDGVKAARQVEKIFQADLEFLQTALTQARKSVLPE